MFVIVGLFEKKKVGFIRVALKMAKNGRGTLLRIPCD